MVDGSKTISDALVVPTTLDAECNNAINNDEKMRAVLSADSPDFQAEANPGGIDPNGSPSKEIPSEFHEQGSETKIPDIPEETKGLPEVNKMDVARTLFNDKHGEKPSNPSPPPDTTTAAPTPKVEVPASPVPPEAVQAGNGVQAGVAPVVAQAIAPLVTAPPVNAAVQPVAASVPPPPVPELPTLSEKDKEAVRGKLHKRAHAILEKGGHYKPRKEVFFHEKYKNVTAPDVYQALFSDRKVHYDNKDYETWWHLLRTQSEDIEIITGKYAQQAPKLYEASFDERIDEFALHKLREDLANFQGETSVREMQFTHPIKENLPFAPKSALSNETHTLVWISDKEFVFDNTLRVSKVPFSDCFLLHTRYHVKESHDSAETQIHNTFEVEFVKSSFFAGKINSTSVSEAKEVANALVKPTFAKILQRIGARNTKILHNHQENQKRIKEQHQRALEQYAQAQAAAAAKALAPQADAQPQGPAQAQQVAEQPVNGLVKVEPTAQLPQPAPVQEIPVAKLSEPDDESEAPKNVGSKRPEVNLVDVM
jgi:hypothetical protein